jgi:diadenosine tetraphosphate (Ap4A) HIT family hydrolase
MPDQFPVSPGHLLVIVTRHESNLVEITTEEWRDLWQLVRTESSRILHQPDVDGVNVGFNVGVAAGQTVDHAHVHIIPRTTGDHPNPTGGVRHVMDHDPHMD